MHTAFYYFINLLVCGLTKDYIMGRISTWQDKMIITMRIEMQDQASPILVGSLTLPPLAIAPPLPLAIAPPPSWPPLAATRAMATLE
jgi:hypothetical protein